MHREGTCTRNPKRYPRHAHLLRYVSREPQERVAQHAADLLPDPRERLTKVAGRRPQEKLDLLLHAPFEHVALWQAVRHVVDLEIGNGGPGRKRAVGFGGAEEGEGHVRRPFGELASEEEERGRVRAEGEGQECHVGFGA